MKRRSNRSPFIDVVAGRVHADDIAFLVPKSRN
jgi:hypothetical protein